MNERIKKYEVIEMLDMDDGDSNDDDRKPPAVPDIPLHHHYWKRMEARVQNNMHVTKRKSEMNEEELELRKQAKLVRDSMRERKNDSESLMEMIWVLDDDGKDCSSQEAIDRFEDVFL